MAVDIIARAMGGRGITQAQLDAILADYVKREEIVDPEWLEELIRQEIERLGKSIEADTTANWDAQPMLIGRKEVIYVYVDKYSYTDDQGNVVYVPGLKVGDGNAYLIDKPFVNEDLRQAINNHINNQEIHITNQERTKWNDKLDYEEPVGDLLEFTRL